MGVRIPADWHLEPVTQQLSETIDWSAEFLGLPEIWKATNGKGIRVAILDTGCDLSHPDLQGAIVASRNFTSSPFGVRDRVGHGTWCAGCVGARANGIGVRGIASECELIIGKCLGDDGSGDEDSILDSFLYAVTEGADIISMSFGGDQMGGRVREAIAKFVATPGKFAFAAAGNAGHFGGRNTMGYPALWPECIAISAVDKNGNLTSWSSYGPQVTVAGPGLDMISTVPVEFGSYATMSGTSMATPCVAAIGALARSKHRELGGATPLESTPEMKAHMQETARVVNGIRVIAPSALLAAVQPAPPVVPQPGGPKPVFVSVAQLEGYQATQVGSLWQVSK